MKSHIFTTPRRGLMGDKPLGAEYMPEIKERTRRMKAATAIREQGRGDDNRQLRLPGF
jgi:hypothetical protein